MDIIAATEILARSSTTTSVGWIGYIVIGAIAGWLAGKIVKGGGSGLLMNIVIGVVGALIGGFLLSFRFDTADGGWLFTLFTATLGSVDMTVPATMRAWRMRHPGPVRDGPLQFDEHAAVPEPAPGELLVAVRACGVCRTDLHIAEGDLAVHRSGVTPGHEVVGEVVVAAGGFEVGDRVGIAWLRYTCGRCVYCRRGAENLCPDSRYTGWDADGGYAEFATVPAEFAHRLPGGYTDTELAPLLCAGITTYSVLGADYGYQLLWVLLLSTVALVIFHGLAARMGVVTGQGLIGLVRQRYGVRVGGAVLAALVVANIGTTCAEFAGIAAGFELFGISRYISVPAAAVIVSMLVLRGSFHRVERLLLLVSTVFLAYIVSGFIAGPDWGAALRGTVVPSMPMTGEAIAIVTATLGTTLAPWGLSFMQSYAVDKKLRIEDLRLERVDVITGAVLTGVIGFFVVVACAATLHRDGLHITDAADAAVALQPLAGPAAGTLFAVGLIGASFLAASILPLSTAYSVCEYAGAEAALDDPFREARTFYLTYGIITLLGSVIVLTPDVPLVTILVGTQVLNAVLLVPLLLAMVGLGRDRDLMGSYATGRVGTAVYGLTTAVVVICVITLGVTAIT